MPVPYVAPVEEDKLLKAPQTTRLHRMTSGLRLALGLGPNHQGKLEIIRWTLPRTAVHFGSQMEV